jgi:DNA (cytosine-5)-methyltransferase 1
VPQAWVHTVGSRTQGVNATIVSDYVRWLRKTWSMPKARLTVADLFCGTGGFSKGFENTGLFDVVFGIDLLPHAAETFRLNHANARAIAADVGAYPAVRIAKDLGLSPGDLDVVVGGPPCQGFSSIRPHRGSKNDDPRNGLFTYFVAFAEYFRPRAIVLENVVGLATHNDGSDLARMQDAFEAIGYDTDWRILNAASYGVPQKRERLIMIGVERGAELSFPPPTHGGGIGPTIGFRDNERMHGTAGQQSLFCADTSSAQSLLPIVTVADAIDDLPQIGSGQSSTEYGKPARTAYQADRRASSEQLELHSSTRHSLRMMEIIRHSGANINCIPSHLITSGFSSCYSRLAADKPSVTITVNFVHPASNRCIHPTLDRALTPREGARLQSYDDDFKFAGNRAQIVKQIGNAVPPLLGRAIGAHVAALIGSASLTAQAA